MVDASQDGLLNKNKQKNMVSFNSISEKQEESSNSSVKNSKLFKSRVSLSNNKSILKSNDISKEAIDINNLSNKKRKSIKKRKTINFELKEEGGGKEKNRLKFRLSETKKKIIKNTYKRTSFKPDNINLFSNQLKNALDPKKRKNSINNLDKAENNLNSSALREHKSLNYSLNNSKVGMSAIYNRNSIVGILPFKNRNTIMTNSDYLNKKYFSNIKMKNTILHKINLNSKNQSTFNYTNLFEKLKDSYLFEKSENLFFKIKICYGFLAVFSFISIVLSITDVIIFNKESKEFMNINYNKSIINDINIDNYFFIDKRKISKRENTIRVFNLIFSLLSFILHLFIFYIKNEFDKEANKKSKKKNYYKYNKRKARANDQNNTISEHKLKIIGNDDTITQNFATKEEKIKLVINCIISISFYPPGINKVFTGFKNNIIYAYSLNSLFLLITFFKLANIYLAIYYLSPFNNLLYRAICRSNMVKLDFKFMFRFLLNLYPIQFILVHFIIIGLVISILIFYFEYFSINLNGFWNHKGYNDLTSFHNEIYLYFFFVVKLVYGNIEPNTILGSFILLIGGTIGLFINSYFIFYISHFMEFKPEEQQAYTKLIKLFNTLNNEHKASNLIKILLLMKKLYIDNQNIENDYKLKKEIHLKKIIGKNLGLRKSQFNFPENDSNDSILGYNDEYKEKKKFLKYISTGFVLKVKLLNECKNFKNIYLVERNYSLSFNDVLKTLEDKMNGNMNQLNNKLEVLIKNDQKFKIFMKNQDYINQKLKKIMGYQDFLLNYLIGKNNEEILEYIKQNKDKQIDFIKSKNSESPRRMKSLINGSFLAFVKKKIRKQNSKKGILDDNKKAKKIKILKSLFKSHKVSDVKRLKSSVVGNKTNFNKINNISNQRKSAFIKISKKKMKNCRNSFDEHLFKAYQKRNKINKIEIYNIKRNGKRLSLSGKQKEIINKWKIKIENK